jgi:formylmethanofuran dehydrogenase subunit E
MNESILKCSLRPGPQHSEFLTVAGSRVNLRLREAVKVVNIRHSQQWPAAAKNHKKHSLLQSVNALTTITMSSDGKNQSVHISNLIQYAHTNYEENPTEALSALLQALTLNSGQASADLAMGRLRDELGEELSDHVENKHKRTERAIAIVEEMLQDESTFLYQRGKQDILRQAMEDGSSVVCTKCNSMVSSARWQHHQTYWCQDLEEEDKDDNNDMQL